MQKSAVLVVVLVWTLMGKALTTSDWEPGGSVSGFAYSLGGAALDPLSSVVLSSE